MTFLLYLEITLLANHIDMAQPEIVEGVVIPTRFEFSNNDHPIPIFDFFHFLLIIKKTLTDFLV